MYKCQALGNNITLILQELRSFCFGTLMTATLISGFYRGRKHTRTKHLGEKKLLLVMLPFVFLAVETESVGFII